MGFFVGIGLGKSEGFTKNKKIASTFWNSCGVSYRFIFLPVGFLVGQFVKGAGLGICDGWVKVGISKKMKTLFSWSHVRRFKKN